MGSWQSVHASVPNRVGPLKDASTSEPDHRIPETKKTPYQILPSSGEVNHDAVRTCQPRSRNLPRRVTGRTRRQRPWLWTRCGLSSPDLDPGRARGSALGVATTAPASPTAGSSLFGDRFGTLSALALLAARGGSGFRSHLTRLSQSFVGIPFLDLRRCFRLGASAASMRPRQDRRSR
jgi:hypothetical protein